MAAKTRAYSSIAWPRVLRTMDSWVLMEIFVTASHFQISSFCAGRLNRHTRVSLDLSIASGKARIS